MEEQQLPLQESAPLPKPISIDVRRLKMKDYNAITELKTEGFSVTKTLIPILGRISNYSEDELWDMEVDQYNAVQNAFFEAVDNIVKKTNAGN